MGPYWHPLADRQLTCRFAPRIWAVGVKLSRIGGICLWNGALAQIWGFPYAAEVQGTILAIVTFLGVVLQISSAKYAGDEAKTKE